MIAARRRSTRTSRHHTPSRAHSGRLGGPIFAASSTPNKRNCSKPKSTARIIRETSGVAARPCGNSPCRQTDEASIGVTGGDRGRHIRLQLFEPIAVVHQSRCSRSARPPFLRPRSGSPWLPFDPKAAHSSPDGSPTPGRSAAAHNVPDTAPAGLPIPPSASSALCTRRRASSWRSFRSGSRPVPGTRRIGRARIGSRLAMMKSAWKSRRRIVHLRVIVPARSILPSVSTVRWCTHDPPVRIASRAPPRARGRAPCAA